MPPRGVMWPARSGGPLSGPGTTRGGGVSGVVRPGRVRLAGSLVLIQVLAVPGAGAGVPEQEERESVAPDLRAREPNRECGTDHEGRHALVEGGLLGLNAPG